MSGRKPIPVAERFAEKFERKGPDECWLWIGHGTNNGYGLFSIKRKIFTAHRYAWIQENGEVPPGMDVCHKCDVRRCVNPAHLFVGTRGDNMRDCMEKGRTGTGPRPTIQGMNHPMRKLNSDDVIKIRQSYPKQSQTELAREYGVSIAQVSRIILRQSWGNIPNETNA